MIIDKYTDIKNHLSLLIECSIASFFLGFLLAYIVFPGTPDKAIICKTEIDQNKLLTIQLNELRKECSQQKTEILKECTFKERNQCLEKIDKYKAVCEQLRCEICKKK